MGIRNAKVPEPTKEEVNKWLNEWDSLEDYRIQEEAINDLFQKTYPSCTDLKSVIIKCSVLNDFYSTNIFKVFPVAKHITEIDDIDAKLKEGDLSLVDEIARVTLGKEDKKKEKYLYSFATKFCSHHNESAYPIYDSYVDTMLRFFRNQKRIQFQNDDLKTYGKFKGALEQFKASFGLEDYTLKQIDKYLWQAGKTYMPKEYKPKPKKSKEK